MKRLVATENPHNELVLMKESPMKHFRLTLVLSFLALGFSVGVALALSDHRLEGARAIASLIQQHKFNLHKAISVAESRSKGKAIRAICEVDEQGELHFHVHCFANDKIIHVDIVGDTGKATMSEVSGMDQFGSASPPLPSVPSSNPSAPPSKPVPAITLAELEFKGAQYVNRRIRIIDCRFIVGNTDGDFYRLHLEQDSHSYGGIQSSKEQMADTLMQLKSGAIINVEGIVAKDQDRAQYILQCDKIEILGSRP